jgi:hypothetical protein
MPEAKDPKQVDDPSSKGKGIFEGPVPPGDRVKTPEHQLGMGRSEAAGSKTVIKESDPAVFSIKSGYLLMGKMIAGLLHIDQLGIPPQVDSMVLVLVRQVSKSSYHLVDPR